LFILLLWQIQGDEPQEPKKRKVRGLNEKCAYP